MKRQAAATPPETSPRRGPWTLLPTADDFRQPLWGFNMLRGAIAVAIVWIGWHRLWRPADEQLWRRAAQQTALKTLAAHGPDLLAQRAVAQQLFAERSARSRAFDRIPEHLQLAEFQDELIDAGRNSGLRCLQVTAEEPEVVEALASVRLQLHGEGDYAALCRFLDALHRQPRLCPVTELQVTKPDQDGLPLDLRLTVRIFAAPLMTAQAEGVRHE